MIKYTLAVVVIFIIVILINTAYEYGKTYTDFNNLRGVYQSSSDFNKEANLGEFILYLSGGSNFNAYILIIDNVGDVLVNESCSVNICKKMHDCECCIYDVEFKQLESEYIPSNLTMKYYIRSGKIILNDSNKIYGCLFKNAELTEYDYIKDSDIKEKTVEIDIE